MRLGVQVGLGHGYIALDGDPASPPPKGHSPQFLTNVRCGQTAGVTKMPLGMEVVLSPGDFVLDGDPVPSPKREQSPQFSAHFYCGQTAGCIKMPHGTEVGLGPDDVVLDGDPAPLPKKGEQPPSPIFGPCLFWPNGWVDQYGIWHGGGPWSRPHCARWGPSSPPEKWNRAPNFRPFFIVAKELDASRCHLV